MYYQLLFFVLKVHGLSPGALGDSLLVGRLLRHRASRKNKNVDDPEEDDRKTCPSPIILQKEGINEILVSNLNDVENLVLDQRIYDEPGTREKYEKLATVIMTAGKSLIPAGTSKEDVVELLAKFQCNNFRLAT